LRLNQLGNMLVSITYKTCCAQVAGSNDKAIRLLTDGLFGSEGLTSCTDDMSYDATLRRIQGNMLPAVPKELQDYLTDKLEPLLKANGHCRFINIFYLKYKYIVTYNNTRYFKHNTSMLKTLIS